MAWESRRGVTKYLTRTVRIPGGFQRLYFGRGPVAEVAEQMIARERDDRGRSPRWIKIRTVIEEADRMVIRFCDRADFLLRATLVGDGFHSVRGNWRRRQKPVIAPDGIIPVTELDGLFQQAQAGYAFAVDALRAFLAADAQTWDAAESLAREAEEHWHYILAKKDLASANQLEEEMSTLRAKLGLTLPSPIDSILTDRVALTRLEVRCCELLLAPTERIHIPPTIQNLIHAIRAKAEKRHLRAQVRLELAKRKLGPRKQQIRYSMSRHADSSELNEANK